MRYDEYVAHDAVSLAGLVRRGEVTPSELLEVALARAGAVNPQIGAIIHRLDAQARREAAGTLPEGIFQGVPFLVKDLDGTLGGAPYNAGSRCLRGYVAPHDSALFARYRAAGLVIFGKTNTPEFGLLGVTEPALHGPTRNPWSLDHTPGGSSGGSAAAVAAGIVPAAHAGDGGGSIRIPASACGLFGLKPTRGRMPLGPDVGEGWHGFVVPHVVSRTVRDSAALLDATHGADPGAPYVIAPPAGPFADEVGRDPGRLRVAFTARSILGEGTHPECIEALSQAMHTLRGLGHDVVEVTLPVDREALRLAYLTVIAACTAVAIEDAARLAGREVSPDDFEPTTWFLGQVGRALSAAELERARTHVAQACRAMGAMFVDFDVLATPTLAYPPARVGELALKPHEALGLRVLRRVPARAALVKTLESLAGRALERTPNTMLFNMTGQPAMSVPLHQTADGLPVGVQWVGRFGDEATLLRLAGQLEATVPWAGRRPGL